MIKLFKKPNCKFLYILFSSLIILNIIGLSLKDKYFFNYSGSIPIGIYKIKEDNTIKRNDVIIFKTFNYKIITDFVDSDKFEFIKYVVGVPGDQVKIEKNRLYINNIYKGEVFSNTMSGKKLPELKIKSFTIPQNKFFLMGTAKNSFDSRYYGLIDKKDITFIVKPFFIF